MSPSLTIPPRHATNTHSLIRPSCHDFFEAKIFTWTKNRDPRGWGRGWGLTSILTNRWPSLVGLDGRHINAIHIFKHKSRKKSTPGADHLISEGGILKRFVQALVRRKKVACYTNGIKTLLHGCKEKEKINKATEKISCTASGRK